MKKAVVAENLESLVKKGRHIFAPCYAPDDNIHALVACMSDIRGRGEITIHFCPGGRGVHWFSLAWKVIAPLMPEGGGGPGVSNDWCITSLASRQIKLLLNKRDRTPLKNEFIFPLCHWRLACFLWIHCRTRVHVLDKTWKKMTLQGFFFFAVGSEETYKLLKTAVCTVENSFK